MEIRQYNPSKPKRMDLLLTLAGTKRHNQLRAEIAKAQEHGRETLRVWHFVCEYGGRFEVVAISSLAAMDVMRSERPRFAKRAKVHLTQAIYWFGQRTGEMR